MWFLAEDQTIRLSLNTVRQKVKNLLRDPMCTLLILDLHNPLRYLEVRGDGEIAPDPDYEFANNVGMKYGADLRTMDRAGESRVIATLGPTRIRAARLGG